MSITYIDLYTKAVVGLEKGEMTLGEYIKMIEPMYNEVVDIVRCRDCKYQVNFDCRDGICGHTSNNECEITNDFFCGRAEQKEK